MSCTLPDYPTPEQFAEASKNVIAKIRGDASVTNACAAHCGWVVAGFVQGMVLPCDHPDGAPHPMLASGAKQCSTPADVADCLERCCATHATVGAAAGFDWSSLLSVLLPLLLDWLKPKPKPA